MTAALTPTLQLATDLIRCRSVTPEDDGCQEMMIKRLEAIGFKTSRLRFGEVDNFWAIRGDSGPLLAFAGHTDVVPTGPEANWNNPPFEPQIIDGMLHGRGAADMKGSLACMVIACENFIAKHPNHKGRIAFLITSDEEGPSVNGTVKVVEWLEAHNTYLQAAAELGLPVFVLAVVALAVVVIRCVRGARRTTEPAALAAVGATVVEVFAPHRADWA